MDEIYHEIYRRMYEDYASNGPLFVLRGPPGTVSFQDLRGVLETIKGAIDASETPDAVRIRPDAKYFLMLNFVEVILLPIMAARASINRNELLEHADNDIKLILWDAARLSREAPSITEEQDEGVTSHNIIQSINNQWNQLKLPNSVLWMK